MIEKHLSLFFKHYIKAFASLSISDARDCYQLPCTLSTPEKIILLANEQTFEREFEQIFTMLKAESISGFKASNASFEKINDETFIVAIDWQFLTGANNLFTEFKAIYHLTFQQQQFRIFNVISQDIAQNFTLTQPFTLAEE